MQQKLNLIMSIFQKQILMLREDAAMGSSLLQTEKGKDAKLCPGKEQGVGTQTAHNTQEKGRV